MLREIGASRRIRGDAAAFTTASRDRRAARGNLVGRRHRRRHARCAHRQRHVRTAGMIVVPCSMKTVAGIASGYPTACFAGGRRDRQGGRRLVLVAREAPERHPSAEPGAPCGAAGRVGVPARAVVLPSARS
ncbi:MAG: flavoprotein [Eggerthellaceae bacterium]